jgi:hypothetical protein
METKTDFKISMHVYETVRRDHANLITQWQHINYEEDGERKSINFQTYSM